MRLKCRSPTGVKRQGFDQRQVLQAKSKIDTATLDLGCQSAIKVMRRIADQIGGAA